MIRATLFNLSFYALNVVLCLACLPVIVMPREAAFDFIHFYVSCIYWLEKHVLGLDYEVRGRENLPAAGPYIVAAKHESAYETFKLHLLWRDPAVVLKRELIRVPLWGRFLARSEPIAIDRGNIRESMRQLTDGARAIRDQGRVLIIFPQGTRVDVDASTAERPYRIGIEQMRAATGMPVIPLALNSGVYWPRRGWMKRPGKVVFEFLSPLPGDLTGKAMLKDLETRLEGASSRLAAEAPPVRRAGRAWRLAVLAVILIGGLYSAGWIYAAGLIRAQVDDIYRQAASMGIAIEGKKPTISGFPGPHRVRFAGQVAYDGRMLSLPSLTLKGIFLPGHRVSINLPQGAVLSGRDFTDADSIDLLALRFVVPTVLPKSPGVADLTRWQKADGQVVVESLEVRKQGLIAKGAGTVTLDERLQPSGEGNLRLTGVADFIDWLKSKDLLSAKNARVAGFVAAGLSQNDDAAHAPYMRVALTLKDRQLYAGPLLVLTIPAIDWSRGGPSLTP